MISSRVLPAIPCRTRSQVLFLLATMLTHPSGYPAAEPVLRFPPPPPDGWPFWDQPFLGSRLPPLIFAQVPAGT